MGKTSDKTVYKTTGWCGFASGSNTAAVDVKDGRIARIRPLHLDDKYTEEELNPWRIEVRGHALTSGLVTTLSPLSFSYKNRVYSKNRVPYPLKRVDWNPSGERNTQNRGISGYERISWDEAAQICADEIRRVIDTYGNPAVYVQGDGHGETKVMHGGHGCNTHLMNLLGGYTLQARQPDSWEGALPHPRLGHQVLLDGIYGLRCTTQDVGANQHLLQFGTGDLIGHSSQDPGYALYVGSKVHEQVHTDHRRQFQLPFPAARGTGP